MNCPKCNSTNIVVDDCFDISTTPFGLTEHLIGHCEDCDATIMFDRVYTFSHYADIELV